MTDREVTLELLKSELTAMFPSSGVRVFERAILGSANIHILYTHNADKSQCQSGILENDRAYMHFTIWNSRDGFYIEYPTTHCGRVFDECLHCGKVKFRKIKGKTEIDAALKLLSWFQKHQAHILKVGADDFCLTG